MSKKALTRAKISGQDLVVTFAEARPVSVWHFSLSTHHNCVFCVQGDAVDWHFGYSVPKGEFVSVARFDNRISAEDAFLEVQAALYKSHKEGGSWRGKLRGAFLTAAFLIIGGALFALVFGGKNNTSLSETEGAMLSPELASQTNLAKPIKNGVPQSADDVLGGPR